MPINLKRPVTTSIPVFFNNTFLFVIVKVRHSRFVIVRNKGTHKAPQKTHVCHREKQRITQDTQQTKHNICQKTITKFCIKILTY